MRGVLIGQDREVAEWAFSSYSVHRMPVNRAFGIVVGQKLAGALLFQNWNGNNIEISFYGEGSMSLGVVRAAARVAIGEFGVTRVTITTQRTNKKVRRFAEACGFKLEGMMLRFYGPTDDAEHAGARYVIFREGIVKLAKLNRNSN